MDINMNENFHQVIGFILEREKFPSFATPYFVDMQGNYCVQKEQDGKIEKEIIDLEDVIVLNGKHNYKGVHYTEKCFNSKMLYAFAYSERDYCVGTKDEVDKFLTKSYPKHKSAIKKAGILDDIIKFVVENRHEVSLEKQKKAEELNR